MRVALVLNPSAGGLLGREDAFAEITQRLAAAGLTVLPGDAESDIAAQIEAAVGSGADVVVVGGGDGTIRSAAQALAGTGVALAVLPLGTMNMLAKDLALPLTLMEAVDVVAGNTFRDVDVGEVNGEVFLINSVLGMPSRMAVRRERRRGRMSLRHRIQLLLSAMRAVNRYPPLSLQLTIEGRVRRVRSRALAVVVDDYDEAPGHVFSRSELDRGSFTVYVARDASLWGAFRLAIGMLIGRWRQGNILDRYETTEITIRSRKDAIRVMNDGETQLATPPLRYRLRPGALKVMVVPPAEGVEAVPVDVVAA
jgi:diacylglycerol kinase family enzyme